MIPEFGNFAVMLALCLGLTQSIVPIIGTTTGNISFMRLARSTAIGQFSFILLSFLVLTWAFVTNDFSVAYVAQNSNTHLPLIYRICAVWGAHEGSILLWILMLTLWMFLVSIFGRRLPLDMQARVLAVLSWIAVGFYLFLLITSNPFLRLLPNIPLDGHDLNPLLQDPGLIIHPPMLYMGYVGFSVPFAFSIAALLKGRLNADWARWARPWTLVAWSFLTFGIVLGSWWAYRELGWGGWWFWDPVENASFLPWLVGTALIHSLVVAEKRQTFKAWTILLAVCAFSLSLLGTFLVRSGVLISVHAFAVDPARGAFILQFLLLVVGGSLALYAIRGKRLLNKDVSLQLWSRETMLLLNNMLFFVAMLTVLLGTLYPLIIDALGMGKLSVGAPYFNAVFVPLMTPLLFLIGLGPMFHWSYRSPKALLKRSVAILLLALVAALTLLLVWSHQALQFSTVFGLSLAFWVMGATVSHTRKRLLLKQLPMQMAHIGLAVSVIGIVLVTAYADHRDVALHIGDKTSVGPYDFVLQQVSGITGPNYTGSRAIVDISMQGKFIAKLKPEQHLFTLEQMALAKTAIDVSPFRDLYVALGEQLPDHMWSVRIYYKPFIRWIWAGGLLMVLGGLLSLLVIFIGNRQRRTTSGGVK
jgi:cytochrome c-type biogenesis protein CcmF